MSVSDQVFGALIVQMYYEFLIELKRTKYTVTGHSSALWEMLNHAMAHYQEHISNKNQRTQLTIFDLLYVSNFKGGNASITEPVGMLDQKLKRYETVLCDIERQFGSKTLASIGQNETESLIEICCCMLKLTKEKNTNIRGFGESYASALLAAHYIDLIPVLDRRILNGAGIEVNYDSQGLVKNIGQHYACLIRACHKELQQKRFLTLRELDKEWFTKAL